MSGNGSTWLPLARTRRRTATATSGSTALDSADDTGDPPHHSWPRPRCDTDGPAWVAFASHVTTVSELKFILNSDVPESRAVIHSHQSSALSAPMTWDTAQPPSPNVRTTSRSVPLTHSSTAATVAW